VIPAELEVRPLTQDEWPQLRDLLVREWGSTRIVSRGRVHDASRAVAIGAFEEGDLVGLTTYVRSREECEVLTLNAFKPRRGIGSTLLAEIAREAKLAGCKRLWLITSNDNLGAISFYERQGLRLAAVHRGAIDEARRLKPSIPEFAPDGTRIHDEVEFELDLEDGR
jgi:ribosomal protein S18 acetylase RimI-like enzyme